MFKNSLLVSLRKLMRNKLYALINVMGLSLGIGACLMIWLIARHELTFDNFQPDGKRIFRVVTYEQYTSDAPPQLVPAVVPPLPDALRSQIPGIEVCAPYHLLGDVQVQVPGTGIPRLFQSQKAILATPEYFRIMPYEWLAGSRQTALSQPNSIVLSEEKARLYFGSLQPESVIGRELIYDDSIRVSVKGVVRDWKEKTDFPYHEFISLATADHGSLREPLQLDRWKGTPVSSRVLLKLQDNVNAGTVQTALTAIFEKHWKSKMMVRSELQPLSAVHFTESASQPSGAMRASTLITLLAIAVFILLLAMVNYVNLSTAQSISRTKEISVRKIMGSSKSIIVVQFLSETLLLSLAAVVIVCGFINPVLSVFSEFIPSGVRFDLFRDNTFIFLVGIICGVTLLAGIYPAWSLSGFNVTRLSQHRTSSGGGGSAWKLRKALIVFQFSISLVFIISAILIGRQIHFMLTSDPGFNSEAVIQMSTNDRAHMDRVKLLQSRIGNLVGVLATARENIPPMGTDRAYTGLEFPGISPDPIQVAAVKADENFVPLYDIKILAGRNLTASDTLKEILINENLSRKLGFERPDQAIGQLVGVWGKRIPIAGVVGNFHQADFHQQIEPQIIMGIECADIAVKIDSKGKTAGDMKDIITRISAEWRKIYLQEPFEYSFLDKELAGLYRQEEVTSWLVNIATVITIFISCIGLFGLTLYSVEQRVREIGIRKILGASVPQIVSLFLYEFLLLVGFALLIASPAAWFAMQYWLQDFAYRVAVSWWIFLAGGAVAAGIAALTVSALSFRAALSDPVKNLKTD